MTIDIACPHCGRPGGVPKEKVNTRLICKKCSRSFHLNSLGRTIAGDPPHGPEAQPGGDSKAQVRQVALAVVVVALVVLLTWGVSTFF